MQSPVDHTQTHDVMQLPLQQAHARSLRHLALLFGIGAVLVLVLYSPPWPGEHGWVMLALATLWAVLWLSLIHI